MMAKTDMRFRGQAILPQDLSAFRSSQRECELALWIDIDAKIVLAVDSALLHPQEALDRHCDRAARALSCPSVGGADSADHIVFAGPMETRILLRDVGRPSQALVCIGLPTTEPKPLLDAMKGFLAGALQNGAPA